MATTGSASQTDFTEDLKKITVRVMHGDDDQILPYADSTVGKAAEEWHIENVQGFSARHAHDGSRDDRRRTTGIYPEK
jgi:hypothetical protein